MIGVAAGSAVARGKTGVRRGFVWLVLFAVAGLSIAFFALTFGKPYMGLVLTRDASGWRVEGVDPNGLAAQVGIKVGDRPLTINGEDAGSYLSGYESVGTVYGRTIKEIAVAQPPGGTVTASLLSGDASPQAVSEWAAYLLVSLVFWAVGFYVVYRKPGDVAATLLCLSSLALGLCFGATLAGEQNVPLAAYVEVASALAGPWLLTHFFHVLPEERSYLRRSRLTYLFYLPAAIVFALFLAIGFPGGQPLPWLRSVRLVTYGLGFLAAIGVALFNYFRAGTARTHQQMKIVMVSSVVALLPFLLVGVLPAAVWGVNVLPYGFNIVFVVVIPIGMAYAVLTQHLMDIDVVIRRGIIYGLITLAMAGLFSAAILTVGAFRDSISPPQQVLIAVALAILAAVIFGPLQRYFSKLVDRLFYKDRYDYRQTIHGLTQSLGKLKEYREISRLIVAAVSDTLNLAGASLFIRGQSGYLEPGASQGTFSRPEAQIELSSRLSRSRRSSLTEFPNQASKTEELAFVVPLIAGEKEVGVLCLSQKLTRQDFSSDDYFLIQGLASVSAFALRNALLLRDVNLRDTFIAIASHELNTPLTSIMGYAELLSKREYPDPRQKRWITQIYDSGKQIAALTGDLLDVRMIQAGRIGLRLEPAEISGLIDEPLAMARESTARHHFEKRIEENLPRVLVDRGKMKQIIWNLLSNAIKYSPGGGLVCVSASFDRDRSRVVVSVSDQGMGISPADQEALFKTFYRVQRPETAGIRGSGLGLYIVKEWTEAMGGEVWLKSELNKGSTFYVGVPVAEAQDGDQNPASPG